MYFIFLHSKYVTSIEQYESLSLSILFYVSIAFIILFAFTNLIITKFYAILLRKGWGIIGIVGKF